MCIEFTYDNVWNIRLLHTSVHLPKSDFIHSNQVSIHCTYIFFIGILSHLGSLLAQMLLSFRGVMFLPPIPVWKCLPCVDFGSTQCKNKVHATGQKHFCFFIIFQSKRPRIWVCCFEFFRADFAHCSSRMRLDAVIVKVVIERWADSWFVCVRFLFIAVAVERVQYLCRQMQNANLNCHVVDVVWVALVRETTVKNNTSK